jgi:glycosyltransferase involved in cell wall biosynthesis
LKIHFLLSSLSTGGAERVGSLLTGAWARTGHDVSLIATYSKDGPPETVLAPDVQYRSLAKLMAGRNRLRRSWPFRVIELARLFRDERSEVVCSFLSNVNLAAILAARLANVPVVVVSERSYPPAVGVAWGWDLARRLLYRFADAVVMQTADGLKWLEATIPRAHGYIIRNPVELPVPEGRPVVEPADLCPAGQRLLLALGRLSPEKRFDMLIDAFSRIAAKRPEWDLAIVGDGPLRDQLSAQVRRLGIESRVHLPGRVGNPQAWYDRADAFAMTSRFEGFPNVLLEAIASGLPVIAVDCLTGPSELVEDGVNGILLPAASDTADLALGLESLIGAEWPALRDKCMQTREDHGVDLVAGAWLELFGNLGAES